MLTLEKDVERKMLYLSFCSLFSQTLQMWEYRGQDVQLNCSMKGKKSRASRNGYIFVVYCTTEQNP